MPYVLFFKIFDLYNENVLCSLPHPKFFDLETISYAGKVDQITLQNNGFYLE